MPDVPVVNFRHDADPEIARDPFAGWMAMRDRYGAVFESNAGQNPVWIPMGYEDQCVVMRDTTAFSRRSTAAYSRNVGPTLVPIHLDPPEHTKYRRLINPLLSPGFAKGLKPKIREWAARLAAELQPKGGSEFMDEFGFRFAPAVFIGLLGLPLEESDFFAHLVHEMLDNTDATDPDGSRRQKAYISTNEYSEKIIAERRARPGDDYISYLVNAEIDGGPIEVPTLQSMCMLLLMAGFDTVASTLGFAFRHLAQHPEIRRRIVADPSVIPNAVEEILRYFPIDTSIRYVAQDATVAGCPAHEGDKVVLPFVTANRDPAVFENPGEFDIDRFPNRHVGFGVGPHRCAGSHLARVELAVALEEWHKQIPDYELVPGDPDYIVTQTVMRLKRLDLTWQA